MTQAATAEFSKWRLLFWPIHRRELKKFIPMLLIYSLVVFNYSMLKCVKDSLLITAPSSGAQAIPFVKIWAILPMAFLSTLIFTRLSNRFNREKVFYILMLSFVGFFLLFACVFYPYQASLHPHQFADKIQSMLPIGFQGLIAIFRNWTFTLFYIMSELWGTIIMSVLFWGFANEVTNIKEAKRFYAILGVGANLATIAAGQMGILLSSSALHSKIWMGGDRWGQSIMLICFLIISTGLISIAIFRWLSHNVYQQEIVNSRPLENPETKIKLGIRKNFAYLSKSKYLLCIAIIVLTYNISLNLIEVIWKNQVHLLHPYAADYNIYMGKVITYVGITSTLFAFFLCGQSMRRFGWTFSAYITPVILLLTGILFFIYLLFQEVGFLGAIASFVGMTPLALCAFLGSLQNCFSKSCKFTFFDMTKEISFIPLSKECKLRGKAAIDGVGSRLGKSGGALIQQFLLLIFGTLAMTTSYVAGILLIIFMCWIYAIRSLGKQFKELTESNEKLEIADDEPKSEPVFSKEPATASNPTS